MAYDHPKGHQTLLESCRCKIWLITADVFACLWLGILPHILRLTMNQYLDSLTDNIFHSAAKEFRSSENRTLSSDPPPRGLRNPSECPDYIDYYFGYQLPSEFLSSPTPVLNLLIGLNDLQRSHFHEKIELINPSLGSMKMYSNYCSSACKTISSTKANRNIKAR